MPLPSHTQPAELFVPMPMSVEIMGTTSSFLRPTLRRLVPRFETVAADPVPTPEPHPAQASYPVLASLGFIFPGQLEGRTESGLVTTARCHACGSELCRRPRSDRKRAPG